MTHVLVSRAKDCLRLVETLERVTGVRPHVTSMILIQTEEDVPKMFVAIQLCDVPIAWASVQLLRAGVKEPTIDDIKAYLAVHHSRCPERVYWR